MKTISLGLPIAAAMLFLTPSIHAADAAAAAPNPPQTSSDGEGRAEWIKRFDKIGDGKLDDTERAAARAAMKEERSEKASGRRQALLQRYDKNGDGVLDADERAAAFADMSTRPRFIQRYDKDGDGKLNAEELAAAKQSLAERWNAESKTQTATPASPSAH